MPSIAIDAKQSDMTTSREGMLPTGILVVTCIAILGVGILLRNTFYGDPTIYLIYARNIARGDFFTFNPGEFSSGSTSPLWALILSVGYLVTDGVVASKWISLVFTIAAILMAYRAASLISGSRLGSSLVSAGLAYFLAWPGLLMYESSLIVLLVSIQALLFYRMSQNLHAFSFRNKYFAGFVAVGSTIPLARPDATVIVLLSYFILGFLMRRNMRNIPAVIAGLGLTLVPSILFFGYSYLTTGSLSVSSRCRSFALQESAAHLGPISYSPSTLLLLLKPPLLFWGLLALAGLRKITADTTLHGLRFLGIAVTLGYVLILTFLSPVTFDVDRYILPALPLLLVVCSFGIGSLWKSVEKKPYAPAVLAIVVILLAVLPLCRIALRAYREQKLGYTFDTIVERDIVERINDVAPSGATILMYEVQDRYYLRSDLICLSLDGITDGKVAPYLKTGDIGAFLLKYKPEYWLANGATNYRPYLAKSLLKQVVDQTGDKAGKSIQINGIIFTNLRVRNEPKIDGFAGYQQLYRLTYRN